MDAEVYPPDPYMDASGTFLAEKFTTYWEYEISHALKVCDLKLIVYGLHYGSRVALGTTLSWICLRSTNASK